MYNRFALEHSKVRIIDDVSANEDLGLSTRFKACLLARTQWVFVQDDDHFMREAGLQRMMDVKAKFPRRIIAAFGRDWEGPEPEYIRKAVQPGPCRIALTILMLTDQDTCKVGEGHLVYLSGFMKRRVTSLASRPCILLNYVCAVLPDRCCPDCRPFGNMRPWSSSTSGSTANPFGMEVLGDPGHCLRANGGSWAELGQHDSGVVLLAGINPCLLHTLCPAPCLTAVNCSPLPLCQRTSS